VQPQPLLQRTLLVRNLKSIGTHQTPTFTKGLYAQVTKQYVIELYNKDN